MEITVVRALYFSGTGTTEKVVCTLAKALGRYLGASVERFDFTRPEAREAEQRFGPGELAVIGPPVYAGRVPNVLLKYLTGKLRGSGALAIPVVLFGNRNFDDGLIELRNILERWPPGGRTNRIWRGQKILPALRRRRSPRCRHCRKQRWPYGGRNRCGPIIRPGTGRAKR